MPKRNFGNQRGDDNSGDSEINISGKNVKVDGNVAGRDMVTTTNNTSGITADQAASLLKEFSRINQAVEKLPENPDVDKSEVKETVEKIQEEVKKGEQANASKVERWLMSLGAMSDDIFQVTAATLTNPVLGVAKAIQLIANKAKEEKAKLDAK